MIDYSLAFNNFFKQYGLSKNTFLRMMFTVTLLNNLYLNDQSKKEN